jgi:GNAT superfamily N-acetyltransferase
VIGYPKVLCVPPSEHYAGYLGRLGQNVVMCAETIEIIDALATGKVPDAAELFFEYMTATLEEVGWPVPTEPSELPEEWRSEVEHLASAYPPSGALHVAYRHHSPISAVGMQARDSQVAEVKHLYVRPDQRGGNGRQLMDALHSRAKENGLQRLVLDVLISRDKISTSIGDWATSIQSRTRLSRCR